MGNCLIPFFLPARSESFHVLFMFYKQERPKHFGIWADEHEYSYGSRQALQIIKELIDQCDEKDITADINPALDYISSGQSKRVAQLRNALKIHDPETRKATCWKIVNSL